MECQKHKYKGEWSFCPFCETEILLKQDDRMNKNLKTMKWKKAKEYKELNKKIKK